MKSEFEHLLLRRTALVHLFDLPTLARREGVPLREAVRVLAGKLTTVVDPQGQARSSLRFDVRRRALHGITLSTWQRALKADPDRIVDPVQSTLEHLLNGTAKDVGKVEDLEELDRRAYVARWIDGLDVSVTIDAEAIVRQRELIRLRDALRVSAPNTFRGRVKELRTMHAWLASPGMHVITGVGGAGKSALVARWLDELQAFRPAMKYPVAWLDFDNSLLDVRRPIGILQAIAEQLDLQQPGHLRRLIGSLQRAGTDDEFQTEHGSYDVSERYAMRLGQQMDNVGPFLVVYDTFERAQFQNGDHAELAVRMLRWLGEHVRGVVVGRVAVKGIGEDRTLALGELDETAAVALLEAMNCSPELAKALQPEVRARPLTLKLAARLAEAEHIKPNDLHGEVWRKLLRERLIDGQLYRRTLDRLPPGVVREVAHAGLLLRRLDEQALHDVLAPVLNIEVPTLSEFDVLAELVRVHDLVARRVGGGLEIRPEIRSELFELAREKDPELAHRLHERALQVYSDADQHADAAFYALLLARRDVADGLWSRDVEAALRDTDVDALPPEIKKYLDGRDSRAKELRRWEAAAAERMRVLIRTGNYDEALAVAAERRERSPDSPLHLLEARTLRQLGRRDEAVAPARKAVAIADVDSLEAIATRAWLAEREGDLPTADAHWNEVSTRLRTEGIANLELCEAAVDALDYFARRSLPTEALAGELWDSVDRRMLMDNRQLGRRLAGYQTTSSRLRDALDFVELGEETRIDVTGLARALTRLDTRALGILHTLGSLEPSSFPARRNAWADALPNEARRGRLSKIVYAVLNDHGDDEEVLRSVARMLSRGGERTGTRSGAELRALFALLADVFSSATSVIEFANTEYGERIGALLFFEGTETVQELTFELIELLNRRSLLDARFFDALVDQFPAHEQKIRALERGDLP